MTERINLNTRVVSGANQRHIRVGEALQGSDGGDAVAKLNELSAALLTRQNGTPRSGFLRLLNSSHADQNMQLEKRGWWSMAFNPNRNKETAQALLTLADKAGVSDGPLKKYLEGKIRTGAKIKIATLQGHLQSAMAQRSIRANSTVLDQQKPNTRISSSHQSLRSEKFSEEQPLDSEQIISHDNKEDFGSANKEDISANSKKDSNPELAWLSLPDKATVKQGRVHSAPLAGGLLMPDESEHSSLKDLSSEHDLISQKDLNQDFDAPRRSSSIGKRAAVEDSEEPSEVADEAQVGSEEDLARIQQHLEVRDVAVNVLDALDRMNTFTKILHERIDRLDDIDETQHDFSTAQAHKARYVEPWNEAVAKARHMLDNTRYLHPEKFSDGRPPIDQEIQAWRNEFSAPETQGFGQRVQELREFQSEQIEQIEANLEEGFELDANGNDLETLLDQAHGYRQILDDRADELANPQQALSQALEKFEQALQGLSQRIAKKPQAFKPPDDPNAQARRQAQEQQKADLLRQQQENRAAQQRTQQTKAQAAAQQTQARQAVAAELSQLRQQVRAGNQDLIAQFTDAMKSLASSAQKTLEADYGASLKNRASTAAKQYPKELHSLCDSVLQQLQQRGAKTSKGWDYEKTSAINTLQFMREKALDLTAWCRPEGKNFSLADAQRAAEYGVQQLSSEIEEEQTSLANLKQDRENRLQSKLVELEDLPRQRTSELEKLDQIIGQLKLGQEVDFEEGEFLDLLRVDPDQAKQLVYDHFERQLGEARDDVARLESESQDELKLKQSIAEKTKQMNEMGPNQRFLQEAINISYELMKTAEQIIDDYLLQTQELQEPLV